MAYAKIVESLSLLEALRGFNIICPSWVVQDRFVTYLARVKKYSSIRHYFNVVSAKTGFALGSTLSFCLDTLIFISFLTLANCAALPGSCMVCFFFHFLN